MPALTSGEQKNKMERYNRQMLLPEMGEEGQQKLLKARVLIVGVGGLGSPEALYLAAAGIGHLGLVDDDVVSVSNLGRQVLYTEADAGKPKAACALNHLRSLNSEIEIQAYPFRLDAENVEQLVSAYDVVLDGCDNTSTRYLLSDTCERLHKPYVYAAIGGYQGQVSVLCCGEEPCTYRTLYPDEAAMSSVKAGKAVIGTNPAITGSVAANEVLKLVAGWGTPLINRLWTIDLLTLETYQIQLK